MLCGDGLGVGCLSNQARDDSDLYGVREVNTFKIHSGFVSRLDQKSVRREGVKDDGFF